MSQTTGLKISLCQMKVVPGRPDLNARYIIQEIEAAAERKVDIIAFPEMCTTGYLIGDIFEDIAFINDVTKHNQAIIEATKVGITAIFGTVIVTPAKQGEDGRHRMHNAGIVAQNGKLVGWSIKTLQPHYRFFNDAKHMYSLRAIVEETTEEKKMAGESTTTFEEYLKPHNLNIKGKTLKVGVILCEDMWDIDYALKPTRILVKNGADILFNLSASPWTWQKNRKRHQVVKDLLVECKKPFCYVNNTGVQNVGKNIISFDGSSTIYREDGERIFEIPPYSDGSFDFIFSQDVAPITDAKTNDTAELYDAMRHATEAVTPPNAPVVIGLSGGIDSSVVAAHFVDVFGPDRVIGVHMPFTFSGVEAKTMAETIAKNLGIRFEIKPISDLVEAICKQTEVMPDSLAYENVQARARQEILSGIASKVGGVFTCNANKVEMAFGYGTLHGDIAGFYAPLADLVKREVRQIGQYMNEFCFQREVIPAQCIKQKPTAGLAKGQFDPFDYGGLERRGYHDEMVRALTEFRKNAEWFLELYIHGDLEKELKLEPRTLKILFPTHNDFIQDLEKWWVKFFGTYFKRNQAPFIAIFSKRAFGSDLVESLLSAHFTDRYQALKNSLPK